MTHPSTHSTHATHDTHEAAAATDKPAAPPPAERTLDAKHRDPVVLETVLGNAQAQLSGLGGTASVANPADKDKAKAAHEA